MTFSKAFDRTGALLMLAALNHWEKPDLAAQIGDDGTGKPITEDHIDVWLTDPSFPIPKHFLARLTDVEQMQSVLKISDAEVAALAKLGAEYVPLWKSGTVAPPDGLIIKMLHLYQERTAL